MMIINCKFEPGQFVGLLHDSENKKRMITQVSVSVDGSLLYELRRGEVGRWHYENELELWVDRPIILKNGDSLSD